MKRILSIDGGGTSGIISATILYHLQKKLDTDLNDVFDIYMGTSTGTIILSLLMKGYTPKEIVDLYLSLSDTVFKRTWKQTFTSFFGLFDELYDSTGFENLLQAKLKRKCDIEKPFYFLSLDITNMLPKIFTNNDNAKLWEIVRSCSSIPTVFEPYKICNSYYVDGGLVGNNPTLYIATKQGFQDDYILSLGNGSATNKIVFKEKMGFITWAKKIPFMMLESVKGKDTFLANKYLNVDRLNIDNGDVSAVSTKTEDLKKLVEITEKYLEETNILDDIVNKLK